MTRQHRSLMIGALLLTMVSATAAEAAFRVRLELINNLGSVTLNVPEPCSGMDWPSGVLSCTDLGQVPDAAAPELDTYVINGTTGRVIAIARATANSVVTVVSNESDVLDLDHPTDDIIFYGSSAAGEQIHLGFDPSGRLNAEYIVFDDAERMRAYMRGDDTSTEETLTWGSIKSTFGR